MSYTLPAIEDAIIARIAGDVSYLSTSSVLPIPPEMDLMIMDAVILPKSPAALVSFDGMVVDEDREARFSDGLVWHEDYTWTILLVARSFRSLAIKFRGDSVDVGAYGILEDVVSALQGEVLLAGMDEVRVTSAQMVVKKAQSTVFQVVMTTGQDREKALSKERGL